MTNLTLNDGTVLSVLEISNTSAINVCGDLATINTAIGAISTDNLKNAKLGTTILTDKVYTGFSGGREGDVYIVTFNMRDKTEIEIINERLDEQSNAIMELAEA